MRGSAQYAKSANQNFPYSFTTCASHAGHWAVYDVRGGVNDIKHRGLTFDAVIAKCKELNGYKESNVEIESDDLYPVQVIMVGDSWRATNHANGELSEIGRQTFKEALPDAHDLYHKWIHVHKCVAA